MKDGTDLLNKPVIKRSMVLFSIPQVRHPPQCRVQDSVRVRVSVRVCVGGETVQPAVCASPWVTSVIWTDRSTSWGDASSSRRTRSRLCVPKPGNKQRPCHRKALWLMMAQYRFNTVYHDEDIWEWEKKSISVVFACISLLIAVWVCFGLFVF